MIDNILKELNETIEKHRHYFLKNTLEQRLELYHQDFEGLIIDNYNPEQGILERCDDAGPGANGKLAFKVTPPGAN